MHKMKYNLALVTTLVAISCTPAAASLPHANMAFLVEGVGFTYVPDLTSVKCEGGTCEVVQRLPHTNFSIKYPASVQYSGFTCHTSSIQESFGYRLQSEMTGSSESSVLFRLTSDKCGSGGIELRFTVTNWSDAVSIASEVSQAAHSWRLCVLRSGYAIECGEAPVISQEASKLIYGATLKWVRSRK